MSIPPHKLRDLTANAPIRETGNAAMSVVNALSGRDSPGVRLLGIAAAFRQMQRASGLSVFDLLGYADNAIHGHGSRRPEFAAVQEYIEREILA